jgi:hypothetical protein
MTHGCGQRNWNLDLGDARDLGYFLGSSVTEPCSPSPGQRCSGTGSSWLSPTQATWPSSHTRRFKHACRPAETSQAGKPSRPQQVRLRGPGVWSWLVCGGNAASSENKSQSSWELRQPEGARHWWLTPIILPTREAEIRRIEIQGQPGK